MYLRDNTLLSSRVGEFIELPDLPGTKPRQFEPDHWNRFLLTPQRWKIASEVIDAIDAGPLKESSRNGFCLLGPQGVGKSALNYLLASIAYVRGWHLQYIPSCAKWVEGIEEEDFAEYFVQQFRLLNEDLPTFSFPKVRTSRELQAEITTHMMYSAETPNLIILDDHDELYRVQKRSHDQLQYKNFGYFTPYTEWTSLVGVRYYFWYPTCFISRVCTPSILVLHMVNLKKSAG